MKKCAMLCVALFFILPAAGGSHAADDWISFRPGSVESYPAVTVLSSTADELILQISFPGMKAMEITRVGDSYQALSLPGGGRTHNLGWAELPTWSRFVAVPQGAIPEVQIIQVTSSVLSGYNVFPAQEQPVDKVGAPEPEFVRDEEFYRKDEFYPDRSVYVNQPKIIRGCGVSSLALFPVQYNPARGELKVTSEITVRLSFTGGNGVFIEPRYRSPYFERLFQNLLLNYSALGPPAPVGGKDDTGCDLLIITHPNFQAWAESLAYWKNQSGIITWVRNTIETGSDTGSIRTYLQNAYDTWLPPPSFLLLIGDAEFIPLFYRSIHLYDGFRTGTDLFYTTLEGSDFFPDLFPGRISVDNAAEAGTVIGKILQYQRDPISSPEEFYDKVLVAGHFQDRDYDSHADRFFIQTSETVRDFLTTQHGKNVERCYNKTSGCNPLYYYFGDPLPFGLTWYGNYIQISNAINIGSFLVNHRDHGGVNGWGDPEYYVSHVNSLNNADRLPVVLSINCETGHFDNETDASGHGTQASAVYFCEAFQRKANGGAVGIFGHTRVSWSGLNDELCKGFYDAIWPDFDPGYPGGGSTEPIYSPLCRMGAVLNFGKFWMYDKYYLTGGEGYPWGGDLETTEISFEMGTWFGDPTMQIWTELPAPLEVSHPDSVLAGAYSVPVVATSGGSPVESLLVCLLNDDVYQTGYTDLSGGITFTGSAVANGSFHLTATKHNFRPYQGSILLVDDTFVSGDANGDSVVDLADVVFLVNYLFNSGSEPFPLEAGDATCDGMIDLADLVFLINFLYKGGPPPDCQ
ncbi:MAG: C25 family cysteine peptidase [Candidatus Zixiibacteriota bacterium]